MFIDAILQGASDVALIVEIFIFILFLIIILFCFYQKPFKGRKELLPCF